MVTLAETSALDALYEGCAIVDRSERGKLALSGAEAKEFLHGQVTNDVESLVPGEGCYAAFLTHKGKMLGDLRILDAGDELLLDTERGTLQELFNMIRRFKLGRDVELHKRTLESGLLSLAGPDARRVAGAGELPGREHAHRVAQVGGATVRLIATDLGVLLCAAPGGQACDDVRSVGWLVDDDECIFRATRDTRPRCRLELIRHGDPRADRNVVALVVRLEHGRRPRIATSVPGTALRDFDQHGDAPHEGRLASVECSERT